MKTKENLKAVGVDVCHITLKELTRRMKADFSCEENESRNQWNDIIKMLK